MRGPFKLATEGKTPRECANWFSLHGGIQPRIDENDGVPWNFMCQGATDRTKQKSNLKAGRNGLIEADTPREYYHQASCGMRLPD